MEVKIEKLPKMKVAFVRHTGPYEECGAAWEKLSAWAGPKGAFGPDTVFIGMSYDDPDTTPPEEIRYDACMTVGDRIQAEGDVGIKEIGGRDYAMVTHQGPYEKLKETYCYLYGKWAQETEREVSDEPSMEIYKNDPENTPPEELMTEIYIPLKA